MSDAKHRWITLLRGRECHYNSFFTDGIQTYGPRGEGTCQYTDRAGGAHLPQTCVYMTLKLESGRPIASATSQAVMSILLPLMGMTTAWPYRETFVRGYLGSPGSTNGGELSKKRRFESRGEQPRGPGKPGKTLVRLASDSRHVCLLTCSDGFGGELAGRPRRLMWLIN